MVPKPQQNHVGGEDESLSDSENHSPPATPHTAPVTTPVTPPRQTGATSRSSTPRSCLRGSRGSSSAQRRGVVFDDTLNETRVYERFPEEYAQPAAEEHEANGEVGEDSNENGEDYNNQEEMEDTEDIEEDTDMEMTGAPLTRMNSRVQEDTNTTSIEEGESPSNEEDDLDSVSDAALQDSVDERYSD